ncbi:MAG: aspartate aminotransferase family protein [Saprospiraceae bacterium]|nr:aspartate aminotransferase family protein [Saprospiraceae bacterium]
MSTSQDDFRRYAHQFVDWMADYMENIETLPVKSQVGPKEIYRQIPAVLPTEGEAMEVIFEDFKNIIMPGVTHWQSPKFFAYFQANTSSPSILAEMLTATLGVQGMKWDTSPASTELEQRVMEWLRDAMGLPGAWSGVIQDTASTATLAALITAREMRSDHEVNRVGMAGSSRYRVYCSTEAHSSVEKGVKIAGLGKENLVKIPTDDQLALSVEALEEEIKKDLQRGYVPLCVVAALGTTGTLAMDSVEEIGKITSKYNLWLHIDAAYAGSAMLLPEYQHLMKGIERADSFVFNPHKWLFTNFDCSAYFVRDREALINTFAILPEYLRTSSDGLVANHCDWGIPLGRRFRSLKLWFVLRHYGLEGLQKKLRLHLELAQWLEEQIVSSPTFELVVPRSMNLVCFYYRLGPEASLEDQNAFNQRLLHELNSSGVLYLTHTKVNDIYVLRMSIGNTHVMLHHVQDAWRQIVEKADALLP